MKLRLSLRLRLTGLAMAIGGCVAPPAALDDAPCPCTTGYICCELTGRCVDLAATCVSPDASSRPIATPSDAGSALMGIELQGIEPSVGPAAGGTAVLIRGARLPDVAEVFIGDQPCFDIERSPEGLRCTTPPGVDTWASVLVLDGQDPDGQPGLLPRGFHYTRDLLVDISEGAGITVFTGGVTVTMLDANRDGRQDLLLVQGVVRTPQRAGIFYQSLGGDRYEDQSTTPWVDTMGRGLGAYAADFDNDGITDLHLVAARGDVRLGFSLSRMLYGLEGGGFAPPVSIPSAGRDGEELRTVVVDLDGDGWLDVFGYRTDSVAPSRGLLWLRNEGGRLITSERSLADLSQILGMTDVRDITLTDIDSDGQADIVLCGDGLRILRNDGGVLTDVTDAWKLPQPTTECGYVKSVDFNLDGRLDLIWTREATFDIGSEFGLRSGAVLIENTVDGFRGVPYQGPDAVGASCPSIRLIERTLDGGVRGFAVHDFDLDGDWDIFQPLAFGRCAMPPVIYDSQAAQGSPRFEPILLAADWWITQSTGVVAGDLDGDGDPEVAMATWGYNNRARLFKGMAMENGSGHFLRIRPVTHGRAAWGVRVDLDLDGPADAPDFAEGLGKRSTVMLTATSLSGQGPAEVLFGLGDRPPPYWVRVAFADGSTCRLKADVADSTWVVERESCTP